MEETMKRLMEAISFSYEDHDLDMEKNAWTIHQLECLLDGLLTEYPYLNSFVVDFTSFLRTV